MKYYDLIKNLENLEKSVFTINDISKIINKNKKYTSLYLYRLKTKNLIKEIEKGKYSITNPPILSLASNILFPSYISFFTSLYYYGLTTQIPKTIQIISLKSKKSIKINDYTIKFIKFKKANFFGYKRERFQNKLIFMAEKEKLLVDSLLFSKYCPLDESYKIIKENKFELLKLIEYAKNVDSSVLIKRMGYLLEINGIDVYNKFKNKINKKFDLLDPSLAKTKELNRKWNLIINRRLEKCLKKHN